jgi:hypothetical protein
MVPVVSLAWIGVTWLTSGLGCTAPPVFNTISTVTVSVQTPGGTSRQVLEGERLENARQCLSETEEIPFDQAKTEMIQDILLIQVKDRYGDRVFEFFTDENFKGNKGKYYRNRCMYRIIKSG